MSAKIAPESLTTRLPWLGADLPGRDLLRFGLSVGAAAVFSAVQVFVIPRRLDLATYGHYRLFTVYVVYQGLLHFGLADGAYLRWAGQAPGTILREWRTIGRWLLNMQLGVLAIGLGVALLLPPSLARMYVLAIAVSALLANTGTLCVFALQAAGDFRAAGRVIIIPPALFIGMVLVLPTATFAGIVTLYVSAVAVAALYGLVCVLRLSSHVTDQCALETPPALGTLMLTGLPVLGANMAAGLSQSADRMLLSAAAPITSFALYGFASTAAVAANSATQALSRVALSHAARWPLAERATFLARFYDVIAAAFGIGLVAEPLFEQLVAAHLPAYVDALPIVRALTLGLPFWIATHVVLVGTLQSYHLVRRQLVLELIGVALVVIASAAAIAMHAPLWGVGGATTLAAALTFLLGAAFVRRAIPEANLRAPLQFTVLVAAQGAALLIADAFSASWMIRTVSCIALAALPTAIVARRTWEHGW